jgi:hypothetical protein
MILIPYIKLHSFIQVVVFLEILHRSLLLFNRNGFLSSTIYKLNSEHVKKIIILLNYLKIIKSEITKTKT